MHLKMSGKWQSLCRGLNVLRVITCRVVSGRAIGRCIADIWNNAWLTVNNDFSHEWGDSSMNFTSNEVTREEPWKITSRVTKKSLFTVSNVLFYFLHAVLCSERTIPLKTIIDRSFCNWHQEQSFLTLHCGVTTVDLWCHANKHCDVIFVDCSCTCKLAHMRSSLVNINHEYQFSTPGFLGLACKNSWCTQFNFIKLVKIKINVTRRLGQISELDFEKEY